MGKRKNWRGEIVKCGEYWAKDAKGRPMDEWSIWDDAESRERYHRDQSQRQAQRVAPWLMGLGDSGWAKRGGGY